MAGLIDAQRELSHFLFEKAEKLGEILGAEEGKLAVDSSDAIYQSLGEELSTEFVAKYMELGVEIGMGAEYKDMSKEDFNESLITLNELMEESYARLDGLEPESPLLPILSEHLDSIADGVIPILEKNNIPLPDETEMDESLSDADAALATGGNPVLAQFGSDQGEGAASEGPKEQEQAQPKKPSSTRPT